MKAIRTTVLVILLISAGAGPAWGVDASLYIEALIDGMDQLIIKGDTLQWEHFDWAAVGRHEGKNEPTIITTHMDGNVVVDQDAWIPQWSTDPPDELRFKNERSSVYTGLNPELSQEDQIVTLTPLQARSRVSITQQPAAANDHTLIVKFDDNGWGGSETYRVRLDYQGVEELPLLVLPQEQTGRRTSGNFGWEYDYSVGIWDEAIRIDLNIQLVGDDPGDTIRNRWEQGIEDIWNDKYEVTDADDSFPIVIDVEWVDSAAKADHVVTVHDSQGRATMLEWYTRSSWGDAYLDEIAAHEAGHMFALYDEYAGGAVNPATGFTATNALMGDLGAVHKRYYEDILAWAEGELDRDFSLTAANAPPAPQDPRIVGYYDPIPEPATLTALLLGSLAVLRKRRKR